MGERKHQTGKVAELLGGRCDYFTSLDSPWESGWEEPCLGSECLHTQMAGPPDWMTTTLVCLSWSHMVHTGRHGRTGKEEEDMDRFSSSNENKTRQPPENRIPDKAPLSPSFPRVNTNWRLWDGESQHPNWHTHWTTEQSNLCTGYDCDGGKAGHLHRDLLMSRSFFYLRCVHFLGVYTAPDRPLCLSLQCLVSLLPNLEKGPGVQLHNPKGPWKYAE